MRTNLRTTTRRGAVVAGMGLAATALIPVIGAPTAGATPAPTVQTGVHVYPSPGTSTISRTQEISFRGVSGSALPTVKVTGSASGTHAGRFVVTSDGGGATWEPATPFRAGEKVTVTSSAAVSDTSGHRFSYTVGRPAAIPAQKLSSLMNAGDTPTPTTTASPKTAKTANAANTANATATLPAPPAPIVDTTQLAAPSGPPAPFITRPDLQPAAIATTVPGSTAPGLLLSTPTALGTLPAGVQSGNQISDNNGHLVWFSPVPGGSADLEEINYEGQPALAYHVSPAPNLYTTGYWVVLNQQYNQIATINLDDGYSADEHALEISPDGTKALLLADNPVVVDDTANGGPPDLTVLEAVIQEIDLKTGAMDFEWHSLGTGSDGMPFVPLSDSYVPIGPPFDYIHINSLNYINNSTILFSARHTSSVYKLDLTTGQIDWRLGGKDPRNQFTFTDSDGGPSFAHDAQFVSGDRTTGAVTQVSIHDNGVLRNPQYTRAVVFNLNEQALTASVAKQWTHETNGTPDLFGLIVGSNRLESNGDQLISYGSTGYADEFDQNGNVVWASREEASIFSYRTLRAPWQGQPQTPPAIVVNRTSPTAAQVTSSWNGATQVNAWQLYGGATSSTLSAIGAPVTKTNFETSIAATVPSTDTVFQMRALDINGATLGISPTTGDAIAAHYAKLGGASSFLGAATGGEQTTGSGLVQNYQGGAIYWSAPTGAFSVRGAILAQYQTLGGPTGILGFPTSDETAAAPNGRASTFQGGNIYWSPATGAFEVQGAILAQYLALGGTAGILGFPTSNETAAAPNGRVSTFQGGYVYWSPATGAFEVQGAILSQYLALNGPAGILGFPTSNETASAANGRVSTFQGGNIYWSPATGAFEVQGAILARYLSLGGPASFLGFPTSNEFSPTPSTRQSNFQFGHHIVYSFTNGTTTVQ